MTTTKSAPFLFAMLAITLHAQIPVAPTAESVGLPRGDTISGYNVR